MNAKEATSCPILTMVYHVVQYLEADATREVTREFVPRGEVENGQFWMARFETSPLEALSSSLPFFSSFFGDTCIEELATAFLHEITALPSSSIEERAPPHGASLLFALETSPLRT